MESQIESNFIETYYPTENDLKNFKEYIQKIVNDGLCVAKVNRYSAFFTYKVYCLSVFSYF